VEFQKIIKHIQVLREVWAKLNFFSSSSAQFFHLTLLPLGDNVPQGCAEHTGNKETGKTWYGGSDVHYIVRYELVLPFDRLMRRAILD
jgi:hypothetical protein